MFSTRIDKTEKSKLGTSIHFKLYCADNHLIIDWKSQPLLGKMPAFNLLFSSSIIFSGSTFETFRKPAEFSGLNFINSDTFYRIQRCLAIPAIKHVFREEINSAREEISKNDLVILGDGRFDSPGKSAKYCTYTCQSPVTKKIIATTTIQTSKGKGSSPLELEGFKSCLHELESYGFRLKSIATDRNAQITKWLRENRVSIEHCFDCWHFSKNIKSKLRKLIKRKGCKIIQEWIKQIGNHLFWCAENCNGDAETLRHMWKSLVLHVINKHRFKRVHPKYLKCQHKTYTKRESLKKEVVC